MSRALKWERGFEIEVDLSCVLPSVFNCQMTVTEFILSTMAVRHHLCLLDLILALSKVESLALSNYLLKVWMYKCYNPSKKIIGTLTDTTKIVWSIFSEWNNQRFRMQNGISQLMGLYHKRSWMTGKKLVCFLRQLGIPIRMLSSFLLCLLPYQEYQTRVVRWERREIREKMHFWSA